MAYEGPNPSPNTMDNKQIINMFQNEPLITNWENLGSPDSLTRGSIFFGVGLVSQSQTGIGLPFDILSFFFVSELIRQNLGMKKVFVLIADTHAISNNNCKITDINRLAKKREAELLKITRNFALKEFEIVLASDIHALKSFTNTLKNIPQMKNQYLKLEVADIVWFQKNKHLKFKIGWSVAKARDVIRHDERFFDQEITKFCPKIALIHVKAGRTLNKTKPKASPYLSVTGEKRILINQNENIERKLAKARVDSDPEIFKVDCLLSP